MPFQSYLIQNYDQTHENEFFEWLSQLLDNEFRTKLGMHVLIGNLDCGGYNLDAVFISNGKIIILDFKDYGGVLVFSENGSWKIFTESSYVQIQAGKYTNPLKQLKKYRDSLSKSLYKHSSAWVQKNHIVNVRHVSTLVVFHKEVTYEESEIDGILNSYFGIACPSTVISKIKHKTSSELQLSDGEILNILAVLGINNENTSGLKVESPGPKEGTSTADNNHRSSAKNTENNPNEVKADAPNNKTDSERPNHRNRYRKEINYRIFISSCFILSFIPAWGVGSILAGVGILICLISVGIWEKRLFYQIACCLFLVPLFSSTWFFSRWTQESQLGHIASFYTNQYFGSYGINLRNTKRWKNLDRDSKSNHPYKGTTADVGDTIEIILTLANSKDRELRRPTVRLQQSAARGQIILAMVVSEDSTRQIKSDCNYILINNYNNDLKRMQIAQYSLKIIGCKHDNCIGTTVKKSEEIRLSELVNPEGLTLNNMPRRLENQEIQKEIFSVKGVVQYKK